MHRLTEIAANGDVEVQPRYQAAALRRLAAYEDMHQDLEDQLENVNEKLADIEENGSADPQAQQLSPSKSPLKRRSQCTRPTEFPNPSVVFFIRRKP